MGQAGGRRGSGRRGSSLLLTHVSVKSEMPVKYWLFRGETK